MVSEISYQQTLVFSQLKELYDTTHKSNDILDKRANHLVAVSGAIAAFVGGAKSLPIGDASPGATAETLLLLLMFVFCIALLHVAARIWKPTNKEIPGTYDTDVLFDDYINQSEDNAYNKVLVDLSACIATALTINTKKASGIDLMLLLLQLQVCALTFSIAWSLIR